MYSDSEKELMIRAIDSFKRKVFIISPEFKIQAANQHARSGRESLNGNHCYGVFHERQAPCPDCPVLEVLRTGNSTVMQFHEDAGGETSAASCLYSYPICTKLDDRDIEGIVMMDFDLPILSRLEEKLKRSNSFLRNLILSAVDGVIAADKKGKIFIFNDAAAEISGYAVEEALSSLDIRQVYPGDGAKEIMCRLRSEEYGGKGKLKSYHVDVVRKTGEIIPISLNASIIYEGEREVATIGFFHDLRHELKIKNELEKTQIQLLQAEKMSSLGKLAAGVAHQLNNPLGGIILFTKLVLEEYDLNEGAKEDLSRILKDAQRCRDTVKELLEFARQTRQMMRPHDINQAISRTLFLLENQAIFQNIEIEKNLALSLPMVTADIQQLNHLFMNIILNAAEAMGGKGRLTINTCLSINQDHVVIEITDTGPGIPDEVLPHIFEPFFTTKDEGKGTGLGLSLVYGIVENHEGRITAKSCLGEGTTFIVELPIAVQQNGGLRSEV